MYTSQWVRTHCGSRKLAEMIPQPRRAASAALFECGSTTVTAIGGCGFWYGRTITPWPISVSIVRSVEMLQCSPWRLYGGSPDQIPRMWSMHSRNLARRSTSRFPNSSQSEARPPGLIPNTKRPSRMLSSIATFVAIAAG